MKTRIGELLVNNGIITETQLQEALGLQKSNKKKLGEILVELGYLTSKDLIWMLSEQADIPFVDIRPEMLDKKLINTFPEDVLMKHIVLPLYETEENIYVAIGDPTNETATQDIKAHTTKKVIMSGADPGKIEHLLREFFAIKHPEHAGDETKFLSLTISSQNAAITIIDETGLIIEKKGPLTIKLHVDTDKGASNNE
jgi:type IV pilus assembly protein PilB